MNLDGRKKMNRDDVVRELLLSDTLKFSCVMFKGMQEKQFIVGEHHRMICDALNRVVKGECKRLIINIAPRYGKCIAPDTRVYTTRGLINASDVREGDMLYSHDNGKLVVQRCQGIEPAHKESVRITMRSGRTIECSADHPMLTTFGYKEASTIATGERIVALRELPDADIADTFPYEIIQEEKISYPREEITRDKFIRLAETFPNLKKYIMDDFYYDRVEKVEHIGMMDLIHIGVDNTHNFIANGLVSHNTELVAKSFIAYGLALNPKSRFLHLSYSGDLAQDNSVAIKDIVKSETFQSLWPLQIKQGSDTKSRWDTEQGGGVYATSTLGQITGFGAGQVEQEGEDYTFSGAIVIDDPIKPEDALSDNIREQVNRRFETTIRNRVNSRNTPIIIIMQRLHPHDLCGYLQSIEPDEWEVLSLPCITSEGEALWPFKHSIDELNRLKLVNSFVFETQYMQNPKPLEGLMYRDFKTYDIIPYRQDRKMCNYTDTADTGADYLCSITYEEHPDALYVTDVLFTKKPMEYTEPALAQMLAKWKVERCIIESNNGGRAFMRNVERISREYGNTKTWFQAITQTKNKQVRIFSNSNEVNNLVVFPSDWETRWSEFASAIKGYLKEGSNAHDDAPDALTGCVEYRNHYDDLDEREIFQDFL